MTAFILTFIGMLGLCGLSLYLAQRENPRNMEGLSSVALVAVILGIAGSVALGVQLLVWLVEAVAGV